MFMVGVQEKQVSKVCGLYGMLDYQALSLTNESHAFILTSRLSGWCPGFFFCCCFGFVFYIFNNLATKVTIRKTYEVSPSFLVPSF